MLTPMPTPSDTITTAASSGIRTIVRHACRTSRQACSNQMRRMRRYTGRYLNTA